MSRNLLLNFTFSVMLKDAGDTTLALALGIGLTVVLIILAGAIVGVKYYHKKWRQTKAKLSPKVSFNITNSPFPDLQGFGQTFI